MRFYEWIVAGLIPMGALTAIMSRSRLAAVAALGVVGYSVGFIFVLFGAPDLAMTQFLVETLTVILFVLVFYHLPRFTDLLHAYGSWSRRRDWLWLSAHSSRSSCRSARGSSSTPKSRLFHREQPAACPRPERRERHSGRFPRVRHTRRDHGPGGRSRRGVCAAQAEAAQEEQPMTSLILSTATRFLLPLLLLFSFFMLIRGHNEPGGGFIGGLVAAAAFALNAIAFDVRSDPARLARGSRGC